MFGTQECNWQTSCCIGEIAFISSLFSDNHPGCFTDLLYLERRTDSLLIFAGNRDNETSTGHLTPIRDPVDNPSWTLCWKWHSVWTRVLRLSSVFLRRLDLIPSVLVAGQMQLLFRVWPALPCVLSLIFRQFPWLLSLSPVALLWKLDIKASTRRKHTV